MRPTVCVCRRYSSTVVSSSLLVTVHPWRRRACRRCRGRGVTHTHAHLYDTGSTSHFSIKGRTRTGAKRFSCVKQHTTKRASLIIDRWGLGSLCVYYDSALCQRNITFETACLFSTSQHLQFVSQSRGDCDGGNIVQSVYGEQSARCVTNDKERPHGQHLFWLCFSYGFAQLVGMMAVGSSVSQLKSDERKEYVKIV